MTMVKNQQNTFTTLKKQSCQKLWSKILTSDGKILNKIDDIFKKKTVQYYKPLFKSESWYRNEANKLLQNVEAKIIENDEDYF